MTVLQNLASGTVATAPSPATSGTTLVLAAGEGARFANPATAGSYPVSIGPASARWTAGNTEIALCTAKSTDTLTLTRAQEGTTARTVIVGDVVEATETVATVSARAALTDYTLVTNGVR